MKTIYSREDKMDEIRKALIEEKAVTVVNEYETFYGVGFDKWLKEGLADLNPTYKVTSMNTWYNYPWEYEIRIK